MDATRSGPAIHLVLGISSVGKSSYIKRRLEGDRSTRIFLAYELQTTGADAALDAQDSIVHYNMLLPWNNDADTYRASLRLEPTITALLQRKARLSATVLVARPATIAKRILLREEHEPELRPGGHRYPVEAIFDFVSRVPASEVYDLWFDLLAQQQIPFQIVSTENRTYAPVATLADARRILQSPARIDYSEAERTKALGNFSYAYQKLDWIGGVNGTGADRGPTLAAIRPYLTGASALDIGCGPGFFCFSLERLGFADVVGTELKKDRFLAACGIREVIGSRCRFAFRDVFSEPFARTFDTVLLLNVLHHVTDPIGALRQASRMCAQRLIVEFATLSDPKFAATWPGQTQHDNAMPLIGVSLLSQQDQTYLFTHEALRRICLDHAKLFSRIEFLPSPMSPDRSIAICTK